MTFTEMAELIAADYHEGRISRGEMIQNASDYLIKSLRAENGEERKKLGNMACAYSYAVDILTR